MTLIISLLLMSQSVNGLGPIDQYTYNVEYISIIQTALNSMNSAPNNNLNDFESAVLNKRNHDIVLLRLNHEGQKSSFESSN